MSDYKIQSDRDCLYKLVNNLLQALLNHIETFVFDHIASYHHKNSQVSQIAELQK